jgi:hypothetical protein
MSNNPTTAIAALVSLISLGFMAPAAADPVETCQVGNDTGVVVDLSPTAQTGCLYPCLAESGQYGVAVSINGDTVTECVYSIEPCPLFVSTGVVINGEQHCFNAGVMPCPEGYYPLPTRVVGVPGFPSQEFLCFALSVYGCEAGVGVTVILRRDGETTTQPVCL